MDNSFLCKEQHGFLPNRLTTTNLVQCDVFIAQYLNAKIPCDNVMLDFCRAFDKVNHDVFRDKLFLLGIQGKLCDWISDFLHDRTQFVSYCNVESASIRVTSGIVQGSMLGPKLFNVYINDLSQQVESVHMLLYADDGKTVSMASDLQNCLRTLADLDAIERWSVAKCLPLSLAKCLCLHLGHGNICYTYTLGGVPLPAVEQCTDLGVMRTSDFSYAAHIHSVVNKASCAVGMITRAFFFNQK